MRSQVVNFILFLCCCSSVLSATETVLSITEMWRIEGDQLDVKDVIVFKDETFVSGSASSDIELLAMKDKSKLVSIIPELLQTNETNVNIQKVNLSTMKSKWSKVFGGLGADHMSGTVLSDVGNVFASGNFQHLMQLDSIIIAGGIGRHSGYLALFNGTDSNTIWAQSIYGESDYTSLCYHKHDNTIIAAGWHVGDVSVFGSRVETDHQYLKATNDKDTFVVKYDSVGSLLWRVSLTGRGEQVITKVIDNGADIYVIGTFTIELVLNGSTQFTSVGSTDIFVAKFGNEGKLEWIKQFGNPSDDIAGEIVFQNTKLYVSFTAKGIFSLTIGANTVSAKGVVLLEIDAAGIPQWMKAIEGNIEINNMAIDKNKSILVAGKYFDTVTCEKAKIDQCKSDKGCFYLSMFTINGQYSNFINLLSYTKETTSFTSHLTITDTSTYLIFSHGGNVGFSLSELFGTSVKIDSTVLQSYRHNSIGHIMTLSQLPISTPVISNISDAVQVVKNNTEIFISVQFSGIPLPTIEWLKDGKVLANYKTVPLRIANASERDAGKYVVKLTNKKGTVQSTPITIKILSKPPIGLYPTVFNGQVNRGSMMSFDMDYDKTASESVVITVKSNDSSLLPDSSIAVLGTKSRRAITIFPPHKQGDVTLFITLADDPLTHTDNITAHIYGEDDFFDGGSCLNEKFAAVDYVYFIGGSIIGMVVIEIVFIVIMKSYYKRKGMHLSIYHVQDNNQPKNQSIRRDQVPNYGTASIQPGIGGVLKPIVT